MKYANYDPTDNYSQQYKWIGTDSDKFQKMGTYAAQFKVKYSDHFEKVHENKVRLQQAQQLGT